MRMLEDRMVIERRIVPGWLGVCQIFLPLGCVACVGSSKDRRRSEYEKDL